MRITRLLTALQLITVTIIYSKSLESADISVFYYLSMRAPHVFPVDALDPCFPNLAIHTFAPWARRVCTMVASPASTATSKAIRPLLSRASTLAPNRSSSLINGRFLCSTATCSGVIPTWFLTSTDAWYCNSSCTISVLPAAMARCRGCSRASYCRLVSVCVDVLGGLPVVLDHGEQDIDAIGPDSFGLGSFFHTPRQNHRTRKPSTKGRFGVTYKWLPVEIEAVAGARRPWVKCGGGLKAPQKAEVGAGLCVTRVGRLPRQEKIFGPSRERPGLSCICQGR